MSNKLTCSLCNQHATVHLTQIINNKIQKIDLCESCAQKKGVTDPEGFSLAEMLSNSDFLGAEDSQACNVCGQSISDFRKLGRFGCSDCYVSLGNQLKPILEEMHVGFKHTGKKPEKSFQQISLSETIELLRVKLQKAIAMEAYEDAAHYRDELEIMKNELSKAKINCSND